MARVKSETLYGLLSRVQSRPDPATAVPLDPGVIDAGTWAVIEMNSSDAEAAFHYISHLARTAIGCEEQNVLRPVNPIPKRKLRNETVQPAVTSSREKGYDVLLIDELLLFDVNHFSCTVQSDSSLNKIGIIQEPDPFLCLASLNRFVSEEALFLKNLQLVVLTCSDLLIKEVLTILRRDVMRQSSVLLLTPHAPKSLTPSEWHRMRLQMRPERRIAVVRLRDNEETDVREYDVLKCYKF